MFFNDDENEPARGNPDDGEINEGGGGRTVTMNHLTHHHQHHQHHHDPMAMTDTCIDKDMDIDTTESSLRSSVFCLTLESSINSVKIMSSVFEWTEEKGGGGPGRTGNEGAQRRRGRRRRRGYR